MGERNFKGVGFRRAVRLARKNVGLFFMIAAICAGLYFINQFTLSIQLEGDEIVNLEYGDHFRDPGASAVILSKWLGGEGLPVPFLKLEQDSDLQENLLGRYTISYSTSFLWHKVSAERKICVIDTVCPEITLTRDYFEAPENGPSLLMQGISATDNYDGDITDRVVCTRTTGWVTYSVVDSSGNPAYVVRELPASADQPPVINLKGDTDCVVTVGSFFEEPGYEAEDIIDGDMTENVTVDGEVNWLIPGKYPITYSVTDSNGNNTTVTRNVYVEAKARPQIQWPQNKTIFLTFDDGPGPYTARLLKILDQYNVKATFFVTDSEYRSQMQDIIQHGHSIGIHTVSHNYSEIYASPEAYFGDLRNMQDIISQNTGVFTTLMRFPGGSSNLVSKKTSPGLMTVLSEAVQDAGFQFFDWNVDSDDAGNAKNKEAVFRNVITGIEQQGIAIVLQHDIHSYSVDAVEDIIQWGLENGYVFSSLTERSPGFHHTVQN